MTTVYGDEYFEGNTVVKQKRESVYEYGTIEKETPDIIDAIQRYFKYDTMFKCDDYYTVRVNGEAKP